MNTNIIHTTYCRSTWFLMKTNDTSQGWIVLSNNSNLNEVDETAFANWSLLNIIIICSSLSNIRFGDNVFHQGVPRFTLRSRCSISGFSLRYSKQRKRVCRLFTNTLTNIINQMLEELIADIGVITRQHRNGRRRT